MEEMPGWSGWLNTLLGLLGGGAVVEVIRRVINRRQVRAEARKVENEGESEILAAYKEQLTSLLDTGERLQAQNQDIFGKYSKVLMENAELQATNKRQELRIETLASDTRILRRQMSNIDERYQSEMREMKERLNNLDTSLAETKQADPAVNRNDLSEGPGDGQR